MTPTPLGKSIRVTSKGAASVAGVNYGSDVKLHAVNDHAIVLRVPGQYRWAGVDLRKYESPSLLVYAIDEVYEHEDYTAYSVHPLIELDLSKRKEWADA